MDQEDSEEEAAMMDGELTLTREQAEGVRDAIRKNVTKPCPKCPSTNFNVETALVQIPLTNDPSVYTIGGSYGLVAVPVTCMQCGFIAFHNIIALGLAHLFTKAD